MEKNEETFKQTFNVDFGENHDEITLSSKKSKICKIAALIIAGIAIITTTVLLVAHFKYGLFGSKISCFWTNSQYWARNRYWFCRVAKREKGNKRKINFL